MSLRDSLSYHLAQSSLFLDHLCYRSGGFSDIMGALDECDHAFTDCLKRYGTD